MKQNKKSEKNTNNSDKISIYASVFTAIITTTMAVAGSVYVAHISKQEVVNYDYKEVPYWDIKNTTEYYPMSKDNVWLYTGQFQRQISNEQNPKVYNVELEIKVLDEIISVDGTKLYILSNYFSEAPNLIEEEVKRDSNQNTIKVPDKITGLLLIGNKFYIVSEDYLPFLKEYLNKNKFEYKIVQRLEEMLLSSQLHLEVPLFKGQRFGTLSDTIRNDLRYFWYVNDVYEQLETNADKIETVPVYELMFLTNPDHFITLFKPYVGFTKFEYEHHGWIDKIELELQSYNFVEK